MTIDDLIKYTARFEPNFPDRIKGGTPEEIDRYANVVRALTKKEIPTALREYMLRMGRKDGGLRPRSDNAAMDLVELTEFQEDILKDTFISDYFPENCVLIGYEGISLPDLCLEIIDGADAPPRVLYTSGDKIRGEAAESLENHLYQKAFTTFRTEPAPYFATYRPRDKSTPLRELTDAVKKLGVVPEPFSDRDTFCGVRGTTCALLHTVLRPHAHILFASRDAHELDRLSLDFQREVGVDLVMKGP